MQDRGYEFLVITSFSNRDTPGKDDYMGIPIRRFPFLKAISDKNLLLMKQCIQSMEEIKNTYKPDLVHLHMSAPISFYHIKTLDKSTAPTLLTLHTCFGDFNAGKDTILGQTLRSARWTTMVSEAVRSDAIKIYPEISNSSSVVYNGLDYSHIDPSPLEFTYPLILGIGRFIREKGFDILVDAFKLLIEKYPQAQLTLVGDGTERKNLEEQVSKLNLQDDVTFTGQVHPQQVPELINQANIVVIPSRLHDSLPTVALEAGLLGRPIVAINKGGLGEIIVNGQTGLLIDGENPQILAATISDLYNQPSKAAKMGQAARLRMQDVFNWDRYLDNYDALYKLTVLENKQIYD
ncbi:MAG: glycosyltransferase family 4 protein [Anaerolineaceae bacterium]|nr:glycosyltransferase family 4 protein [Anaerolineaceae bacterium]